MVVGSVRGRAMGGSGSEVYFHREVASQENG